MKIIFNIKIVVVFLTCVAAKTIYAQEEEQPLGEVLQLPDKVFKSIDKKSASIERKLTKQTEKYLSKMERQENKLRKKLQKSDSTLAKELFEGVETRYAKLKSFSSAASKYSSFYSSHVDSLSTSLSFLKEFDAGNFNSSPAFQNALNQYKSLQQKFTQAEQIRNFVTERQRMLKKQFENLGMIKQYRKFQQQVYYYKAQVQEYQNLLSDPSKLEAKLVQVVRQLPQFKQFFAKNSMLASLFPNPGMISPTSVSSVGLQTRMQVVSFIQNQTGGGSQNANALIQRSIGSAQGSVDQLRNKLNSLGNKGDLDVPDFKPNYQKTKSFFQRIEYGTNLQSQHGTFFFPITTDLGMSVGYKLNDKNRIGIGMSYKLGWGKDIQHISMSSEGAGFRSFLDINIKKTFFASGGFEYNYQKPFDSFQQISYLNDWHQSGLIGATKIFSVKTKIFKQAKIQLLWDFLSYQQRPQAQAFKFRIGYNF